MFKKISVASAAAIAGVVAMLTFSVTSFWAFQIYNDSVSDLREKAVSIEDMYTVCDYIDKYYYLEYDEREVVDASLKAMVSALDDKYSGFMSAAEYEQSIIDAKGSVSGIGITVNKTENDEITVVAVTEGAPAERAGIKVNDIIVAIDGQDVSELEYQNAVNLVRGDAGKEVALKIKRGEETLEFTIMREKVENHTVTSKMLDNDIAYIRISGFKENTSYQYNEALKKHLEDGAKGIIFDVRNNGGGLVAACEELLDPLLPEGDIAVAEFKDGSSEVICRSDDLELDMPMLVLINKNSASAAELFAASLKDFGKAELVGVNSFGKGIMQNTYDLKNGGGLRLTIARYRTTKSECYHGVGLAPDYEVELPEKYAETAIEDIPENDDTQLQKAIQILRGRPF